MLVTIEAPIVDSRSALNSEPSVARQSHRLILRAHRARFVSQALCIAITMATGVLMRKARGLGFEQHEAGAVQVQEESPYFPAHGLSANMSPKPKALHLRLQLQV